MTEEPCIGCSWMMSENIVFKSQKQIKSVKHLFNFIQIIHRSNQ